MNRKVKDIIGVENEMKHFTVNMLPRQIVEADSIALKLDITRAQLIRKAVKEFLERNI